ncbi:MAG: hypothetical protein ACREX9_20390 [Gammaproteobacteria bacterium]
MRHPVARQHGAVLGKRQHGMGDSELQWLAVIDQTTTRVPSAVIRIGLPLTGIITVSTVAWPVMGPFFPCVIVASTEAVALPLGAVTATRAPVNSSRSTVSTGLPAEAPLRGRPKTATAP